MALDAACVIHSEGGEPETQVSVFKSGEPGYFDYIGRATLQSLNSLIFSTNLRHLGSLLLLDHNGRVLQRDERNNLTVELRDVGEIEGEIANKPDVLEFEANAYYCNYPVVFDKNENPTILHNWFSKTLGKRVGEDFEPLVTVLHWDYIGKVSARA
jgi:hypothetical protein